MNKDSWDALSPDVQAAISQSVAEFAQSQVAALAEKDLEAVAAANSGGEVTVIDWPEEERAKFRTIAASQWESVAGRSPNAQKVYAQLTAYLKANGLIN